MKKIVLFSSILLCCSGIFAQQSLRNLSTRLPGSNITTVSQSNAGQGINKKVRIGKKRTGMNSNELQRMAAGSHAQSVLSATEHIIGTTVYDQQTNGTISNRFVNNADGSKSASWTMSHTSSPWADRGTGYNYYNGSTWGASPGARVEAFRVGYTNVAVAASGEEAILAHSITTAHGLAFSSRPVKGTGSWTTTQIPGTDSVSEWPKIVAGGANGQSFHAIWISGAATNPGPLYYSRSTNNGATWSTAIQLPGLDTGTFYRGFNADNYSIDARGDVVAVVVGGLTTDVVLMKSTNNGAPGSWVKTVVDSFPIPFFNDNVDSTDVNHDGIVDTLFTNTGDPAVLIDNNDSIHVFFGGTNMFCADPGPATTQGGRFFVTQRMFYWNESMAPNASVLIATAPDLNGDSVISLPTGCNFDPANFYVGYYATLLHALIEMPSAGVDGNNNLYLCYQALDELSDTSLFGEAFMHPYIIKSKDGGLNWTNPDDATDAVLATQPTAGQGYDGVYPAMAKRVDSKIHLIYQRDFAPGTTLSGSTTPNCESGNNLGASNDIVYVSIDTNFVMGVQELIHNTLSFSVSSNYPNPFTGKTSFDINLVKTSDVFVEVSNLLGETLSLNKYNNLNSGFHSLTIDGNKLSPGIYFYKVKVGEEEVTRKMIVE